MILATLKRLSYLQYLSSQCTKKKSTSIIWKLIHSALQPLVSIDCMAGSNLSFYPRMSISATQDSCSGRTALHYAVEAENFTLVNFLLESSCNVNAPTFAGNTPLHIAAGRRLKEIVALLMAYGANPALANGEGDFPSDLPASLLVSQFCVSVVLLVYHIALYSA